MRSYIHQQKYTSVYIYVSERELEDVGRPSFLLTYNMEVVIPIVLHACIHIYIYIYVCIHVGRTEWRFHALYVCIWNGSGHSIHYVSKRAYVRTLEAMDIPTRTCINVHI